MSDFPNLQDVNLCLKIFFILTVSAYRDGMPHTATFYLGLHFLSTYSFTSFDYTFIVLILMCIYQITLLSAFSCIYPIFRIDCISYLVHKEQLVCLVIYLTLTIRWFYDPKILLICRCINFLSEPVWSISVRRLRSAATEVI